MFINNAKLPKQLICYKTVQLFLNQNDIIVLLSVIITVMFLTRKWTNAVHFSSTLLKLCRLSSLLLSNIVYLSAMQNCSSSFHEPIILGSLTAIKTVPFLTRKWTEAVHFSSTLLKLCRLSSLLFSSVSLTSAVHSNSFPSSNSFASSAPSRTKAEEAVWSELRLPHSFPEWGADKLFFFTAEMKFGKKRSGMKNWKGEIVSTSFVSTWWRHRYKSFFLRH